MVRKRSEVENSLLKKGFLPKEGDHHYFIYHTKTGKKSRVFTKTSHGAKEIDDHLLGKMAQQCKLNRQQFDRLIECPLKRSWHCSGFPSSIDPPARDGRQNPGLFR